MSAAPLQAQIEPSVQTVEFGRPAAFTCVYKGNPVKTVEWMKDGKLIGELLIVRKLLKTEQIIMFSLILIGLS